MQANAQKMIQQAGKVLANAYAPYSNFAVAACLITPDQQIFTGCNHENASYALTVCAETAAIAAMVTAGYTQISEIVVMAKNQVICPPCGACRQRIAEFAKPTTLVHLCNKSSVQKTYTIAELLPQAFALS